jgi:hypothetical protein
VLGLAYRVAWFGVSVRNIPVSTDESITVLQAKAITEDRRALTFRAKQHPPGLFGRFPLLFTGQPYLFPIESYLAAPFAPWLPRTPFGARVVPAVLGLLSVVCSLAILRAWGPLCDIWPAALLLIFPSTYLVMLQCAYALPGYVSFLLLIAVVVRLAQWHARARGVRAIGLALAAGLLAGLACSGNFMAIAVAVAAGTMVCLAANGQSALASTPAFLAGVLAGMGPYLLGKRLYADAYGAVTMLVPWRESLKRLWSPILDFTLPSAMGVRCCLFPDGERAVALVPGAEKPFAVLWVAIVLAATALAAWQFARRLRRDRWPSLTAGDALAGATWLCLALFLLNRRSHSVTFRYLLVAVWTFPFLVAALYAHAGRWLRWALAGLCAALAALNLATGAVLMGRWSEEGFAAREPRLYALEPAIRELEARGINRCYAAYFDAYRLTFMTDERILCSQPYNERFLGWPIPYKDLVDASTNAAYVLGPTFRFRPEDFEQALAAMEVTARREPVGSAFLYTGFESPRPRSGPALPGRGMVVLAGQDPRDGWALHDGRYETRWRSVEPQRSGMSLDVTLAAPASADELRLYYNGYPHDRARSLNVFARGASGWEPVATNVGWRIERFEFVNGHPVFGDQFHSIRFPPVTTDTLRIEIAEPEPDRCWTLGEIELRQTEKQPSP